jgi:hypothetical protein
MHYINVVCILDLGGRSVSIVHLRTKVQGVFYLCTGFEVLTVMTGAHGSIVG